METEKKMDKKPRTGLWSSHNLNEESLTDTQIDFLMSCFEQNLEHARHVENERLTFNSIYMALVGGVLAFVYSTEVKYVMFSVGVTVLLIITGFIAMLLTKRWDNTFDRHIEYAKGCYRLVHESLFPDDGGRQLCLQNLPDAAAVQILLLADPAGADRVDGVLPDADVDGQRKMTCAGGCGHMVQQPVRIERNLHDQTDRNRSR